MSQPSRRRLTEDEAAAVRQVIKEARSNAWTLLNLITTFFVPVLATFAFVALYPPFWRPSLAASAAATATLCLILYGLGAWRIFRPVRRLKADLAGGEAEARDAEVRDCDTSAYLVSLTLADQPQTALKLPPPLIGRDERHGLTVGAQVHVETLPHSGRLLLLRQAG
jgi:hypothetical protein